MLWVPRQLLVRFQKKSGGIPGFGSGKNSSSLFWASSVAARGTCPACACTHKKGWICPCVALPSSPTNHYIKNSPFLRRNLGYNNVFFIQKSGMAASCVDTKGKRDWGERSSRILRSSYRLKYLNWELFYFFHLFIYISFSLPVVLLFTTGGLLQVAFDSSFCPYHGSFRLPVNVKLLWTTSDMTFWWESQTHLTLRICWAVTKHMDTSEKSSSILMGLRLST